MDFEANRRKILEDIRKKQRDKKVVSAAKAAVASSLTEPVRSSGKENVVLFGQKSLFLNNLVASLSSIYTVTVFYDVDKATDFISEKGIKFVLIDIDPPSDYHVAANFLTVVKTVSPGTLDFVCTKDKTDSRARSLASYGGVILEKPISIPEIKRYIEV